jgi:ribosome-binding protein aMBF1 (putative translation factor)
MKIPSLSTQAISAASSASPTPTGSPSEEPLSTRGRPYQRRPPTIRAIPSNTDLILSQLQAKPQLRFYDLFLQARLRLGLRQDRVAELTGIKTEVICRIEKGRSLSPAFYTVKTLANFYNISLDDLI